MSEILEILGLPFLLCLLMAVVLGYLGIHVLKREVIFVDISLAQIAAVASILAHIVFKAHSNSVTAYVLAAAFIAVTSAFYAVVRKKVKHISLEAIIGVTYAIAAAAALFLLGIAPGGHLHVQQMLAGNLLWVNLSDIMTTAAVFSAVTICFLLCRNPLSAVTRTYQKKDVDVSWKTMWWDFFFYMFLGVVIISAVKMAGIVVVFAYLVIPAAIAFLFARQTVNRLIIIWSAAVLASIGGLLFSYYLDFSVGPSIAAFLGGALILAALLKSLTAHLSKKKEFNTAKPNEPYSYQTDTSSDK